MTNTPLPEGYIWCRVLIMVSKTKSTRNYHVIAPDQRTLCGEPVSRMPKMRKGFQDVSEKPQPFDCHECFKIARTL